MHWQFKIPLILHCLGRKEQKWRLIGKFLEMCGRNVGVVSARYAKAMLPFHLQMTPLLREENVCKVSVILTGNSSVQNTAVGDSAQGQAEVVLRIPI